MTTYMEAQLEAQRQLELAQEAMGFEADQRLRVWPRSYREGIEYEPGKNAGLKHVALTWPGGVLWLDMKDLRGENVERGHFCIDVRVFQDAKRVPVGVFGMHNGRQFKLDDSVLPEEDRKRNCGWPAAIMPILLWDPDSGEEVEPGRA